MCMRRHGFPPPICHHGLSAAGDRIFKCTRDRSTKKHSDEPMIHPDFTQTSSSGHIHTNAFSFLKKTDSIQMSVLALFLTVSHTRSAKLYHMGATLVISASQTDSIYDIVYVALYSPVSRPNN